MNFAELRGAVACLGKASHAAAGAATTYDIGTAFDFSLAGKLYTKATVSGGASPTLDANTGVAFLPLTAGDGCTFVWMVNAAGTVAVAQGPVEDFEDDARPFPAIPSGYCPYAYQTVEAASTASSWTFGAANWNATGITSTIVDVSTLPSRPPL